MIDFHSHVLPAIDDGSKSVEESLQLLKMLAEQGVKTVAATPHFYPNRVSVERFLEKRQAAYQKLLDVGTKDLPNVILGAEVYFYEGISRMPQLSSLCLQGTKLLLLEMPFAKWSDYAVRELLHLANAGDFTIVLAHVERYLFKQDPAIWEKLIQSGVIMQANATFFTAFSTRRKALKLLKNRFIRLIGSDCHSVENRPPRIGEALARIEKKLGIEYVERLIERGNKVLTVYAK